MLQAALCLLATSRVTGLSKLAISSADCIEAMISRFLLKALCCFLSIQVDQNQDTLRSYLH